MKAAFANRLLLRTHEQLAESKTPDEKTRLEREIKASEDEIDRLVYEVYGLTDEEIGIVDERTMSGGTHCVVRT